MPSRRRPGRLWLFFWGRKRRGFPGLAAGILALIGALALGFGIPGGADLSRYATLVTALVLVLLILASIGAVLFSLLRRPGRR